MTSRSAAQLNPKKICTKHQREKFKIAAASRPISYSQISPSAAESLQSSLLRGPMRAGMKNRVGGGGGGSPAFPRLHLFHLSH